jgi:divalent metal cation (Fe/Co/Zn/Cd) transporter
VAFALGSLIVSFGQPGLGDRIDPLVALVMAFYMLWVGAELVRHNFRALMDLPLSEAEQLTIMRVLAHHYSDYDLVGTVCSRVSGNRRFVEIELGFDGDKTVEHVHALSSHMEKDLAAEVPGLHFRVVPVWEPEPERTAL